ncbi:MAG TPA: 30S ribosomal protein S8 [Patescibacteria group bacterium]|nr:30S ribosomal protein S8 [Patescibacteria group bacterium]
MSLQSTDPIADLLTRIRNAAMVGKTEVRVPTSKIKQTVAEQLVKNGYLVSAVVEDGKPRGTLVVTINKDGETPTFTELSRMSKPGRRMYANVTDIPNVKQGRGIVLISTSRGVMTGREAIKQRLGGELLLKVY